MLKILNYVCEYIIIIEKIWGNFKITNYIDNNKVL